MRLTVIPISDPIALDFGKYEGVPLTSVGTSYLSWLVKTDWFPDAFPDEYEVIAGILAQRTRDRQRRMQMRWWECRDGWIGGRR